MSVSLVGITVSHMMVIGSTAIIFFLVANAVKGKARESKSAREVLELLIGRGRRDD